MMRLKVEQMTCGHCAATVQKAVKSVDPNADVQVDLAGGVISVTTTADGAVIGEAIREAGYPNQRLAA
jgi:copper chaperone